MSAAHFGLNQEPFRLTPDPRFLHLAETHRNTLRSLLEGVSARKGLQVAMGPIGTGKTTLLYCLQHILNHESSPGCEVRSAFIVNPLLQQDEFLETLLDELEVACDATTKPARLRAFHRLLLDAHVSGGGVLIIIDEAHLLPPALLEEIRLLLNLDSYPVNVLQIILCGQPELMQVLLKPQCAALRARIAVVSTLRPLTLMETRAYVAERLHIAGLRGDNLFSTLALEEVFRQSNGVPRRINLLCDRAMTFAARRQTPRIGPEFIVEAVDDLSLLDISPAVPVVAHQGPAIAAPKGTP
ncbi:MAG: ExeA family protein [Actinomycetota bacterium]